jgi:4-hydroxymandelate oxidase
MKSLLKLADFESAAAEVLDPMTLGYFASGSDDQVTLAENGRAWQALRLRPRNFVDVSNLDLSTTVLGQSVEWPVLVAPMAFQQLAHPEGEVATVRGVGAMGTVFCLSTISNRPMEEVLQAATGPIWFQLYVDRDRDRAVELIRRAERAGCQALMLTVDTPRIGNRESDVHTGFTMPAHLRLPNLRHDGVALTRESAEPDSALARFAAQSLDPSLTWKDLEWFASQTSLPVVAKGILRGDQARKAVDHGARAVVVSNHGGRQLDTTIPTAWALPEVVEAVGTDAEVYVDGGIRRGTDVLKALSLGARAVLVGRPVLWGLALEGADGVTRVLRMLREELELAMMLAGCPDLSACTTDLVWHETGGPA